jgi:hypothetical protein
MTEVVVAAAAAAIEVAKVAEVVAVAMVLAVPRITLVPTHCFLIYLRHPHPHHQQQQLGGRTVVIGIVLHHLPRLLLARVAVPNAAKVRLLCIPFFFRGVDNFMAVPLFP